MNSLALFDLLGIILYGRRLYHHLIHFRERARNPEVMFTNPRGAAVHSRLLQWSLFSHARGQDSVKTQSYLVYDWNASLEARLAITRDL